MSLRPQPWPSDIRAVLELRPRLDLFGGEASYAVWLAREHARFVRAWRSGTRRAAAAIGSAKDGIDLPAEHAQLAARWLVVGLGEWVCPWFPLLLGSGDGREGLPCPFQALEWKPSSPVVLLPPTLIAARQDVSACVDRLLQAREAWPARLIFDAATVLAEMAHNVCEHSGSHGCVVASWATIDKGSGGELCLGVADAGVGMAATLTRREGAHAAWGRKLREALTPSPSPRRDRGAGLRLSRAVIDRYRGALHLRSGGLVVTAGAQDRFHVSRCARHLAAVPGTQLWVRMRPGADVDTIP